MRRIDSKFSTEGFDIFNTVSREHVPESEPLFLLRARDHNALNAILAYRDFCAQECNDLHLAGLDETIAKFRRFAVEHPERMKQPGVNATAAKHV